MIILSNRAQKKQNILKVYVRVLFVFFLSSVPLSEDAFCSNREVDEDHVIVVVTGASGDIGTEIVSTLLEKGCFVVAHYNTDVKNLRLLLEKYSDNCVLLQSNFEKYDSICKFWEQALKWKGHVDCLINCAGKLTFVTIESPDELWCKSWEDILKVNLIAPSLLCKKACEHFLKIGHGIIVNISSRTADNGYPKDGMHYAASKAGLKVLSKSIAVTYGSKNILSYTISPGCVDTKMVRTIDEATLNDLKKEIPTQQFVQPKEIAELVSLICLGKIKNATGASFDLNGASYLR